MYAFPAVPFFICESLSCLFLVAPVAEFYSLKVLEYAIIRTVPFFFSCTLFSIFFFLSYTGSLTVLYSFPIFVFSLLLFSSCSIFICPTFFPFIIILIGQEQSSLILHGNKTFTNSGLVYLASTTTGSAFLKKKL